MRDTHTIANSLKERNSLSVEQVFTLSGNKRKPTKKADYRAPINRPNELTVELLPTKAQLAVFRRFNELTSSVWDFDYARHVKHGVTYEELAACLKGHFDELPAEVKQTTAWLAERAIRNHITGDGKPSDERVEFSFRFKYVSSQFETDELACRPDPVTENWLDEFRSRSPHAFKRGVKVRSTAIVDK